MFQRTNNFSDSPLISPIASAMMRHESTGARHGYNPYEYLRAVQPRQSTAAAMGIVWSSSSYFYDLLDEMARKDAIIGAAVEDIASRVASLNTLWEASGGNRMEEAQSSMFRDELDDVLSETNIDEAIKLMASSSQRHGFSALQVLWKERRGKLVPDFFLDLHPGQVGFDIRRNVYIAEQSQWSRQTPGNVIVARYPARYGSPFPEPPIFPLQFLYEFKLRLFGIWVRALDRYGTPFPLAKVRDQNDDNRTRELNESVRQALADLSSNMGIVVGEGVDIEFVDRAFGSGGDFSEAIRYIDSQVTLRIRGGLLDFLDPQHNTRAASEQHSENTRAKVVELAKIVASPYTSLARRYIELNYGQEYVRFAPHLSIDFEDSQSLEDSIQILTAARENGIPVRKAQGYQMLGLERPEDGDDVIDWRAAQQITGEEARGQRDSPRPFSDRAGVDALKSAMAVEEETFLRVEGLWDVASEESSFAHKRFWRAFLEELGEPEDASQALRGTSVQRAFLAALDIVAASDGALFPQNREGSSVRAFTIARLLSLLGFYRQIGGDGDKNTRRFADDVPLAGESPEISDAIRWAVSRGILRHEEIQLIIDARFNLSPQRGFDAIIQEVREEYFSVARAASETAVTKIRDELLNNVQRGENFLQFRRALEAVVDADELPGASGAYLENVYRTETSNVYARQREANFASPSVQQFIKGFVFFNPSDDRSRPSHAAIDGLRVEKGSPAEVALRPGPPWHYQCRCLKTAIISADPNYDVDEPDDAMELAINLERW